MAKDFKSFYESKRAGNSGKATAEPDRGGADGYGDILNKYKGKSESELMQELFKLSGRQKSEGSLKNSDLDAFAEQIAPYLSAEQSARLGMLIAQLKNQ